MSLHKYTVIFELAEEGGYCAHVPALDVSSEGETLDEAREMVKEAIVGYLEALEKDGMPAPVEQPGEVAEPIREVLEVSVA